MSSAVLIGTVVSELRYEQIDGELRHPALLDGSQ